MSTQAEHEKEKQRALSGESVYFSRANFTMTKDMTMIFQGDSCHVSIPAKGVQPYDKNDGKVVKTVLKGHGVRILHGTIAFQE